MYDGPPRLSKLGPRESVFLVPLMWNGSFLVAAHSDGTRAMSRVVERDKGAPPYGGCPSPVSHPAITETGRDNAGQTTFVSKSYPGDTLCWIRKGSLPFQRFARRLRISATDASHFHFPPIGKVSQARWSDLGNRPRQNEKALH